MIIAKLIDSLALLVVYPHDHPHTTNECLAHSYFGTYGSQNVFIPSESCINSFASTDNIPSVYVHPGSELVWVEQAALEPRLLMDYPFSLPSLQRYLAALPDTDSNTSDPPAGGQHPLSGPIDKHLLHHTPTSALLALPSTHTRQLSLVLPPTWRIYVLPARPYSFPSVPEPAIARVRDILKSLRFSPDVSRIVSNISLPQARNDLRFLTGEDPQSRIQSRHSFSDGSRIAAEWLKVRFEETGARCELRSFRDGFAPNVIWYVLCFSRTQTP
jgi:hypothetical protein